MSSQFCDVINKNLTKTNLLLFLAIAAPIGTALGVGLGSYAHSSEPRVNIDASVANIICRVMSGDYFNNCTAASEIALNALLAGGCDKISGDATSRWLTTSFIATCNQSALPGACEPSFYAATGRAQQFCENMSLMQSHMSMLKANSIGLGILTFLVLAFAESLAYLCFRLSQRATSAELQPLKR